MSILFDYILALATATVAADALLAWLGRRGRPPV